MLTLLIPFAVLFMLVGPSSDNSVFRLVGIAAALMVGFFEELGWMGFAVARLRLRYGVFSTGLIAGVL